MILMYEYKFFYYFCKVKGINTYIERLLNGIKDNNEGYCQGFRHIRSYCFESPQ